MADAHRTRTPLSSLPYWPRFLSREEAARYVGVSADVFDAEVSIGMWPAAKRRGGKGGRLTWDRCLLDATADLDSGLAKEDTPAPEAPSGLWGNRSGTAKGKRAEQRPQKAA